MKASKLLPLMKKYAECPNCGNAFIGKGEGGMSTFLDLFKRWCSCGYVAILDEDGKELNINEEGTTNRP